MANKDYYNPPDSIEKHRNIGWNMVFTMSHRRVTQRVFT